MKEINYNSKWGNPILQQNKGNLIFLWWSISTIESKIKIEDKES